MAGYFEKLALAKNTGDHCRPIDPLIALIPIEFKNIPVTFMVVAQ
jgi:hypothetical protein